MFVKQLSVFLENTEGRLDQVLKILAQGGIDILSASLADTMEYGVLRLITKDPDKAKQILKESGFAARIDEVIAVVVPDAVGSLAKVVAMIHAAGINISYLTNNEGNMSADSSAVLPSETMRMAIVVIAVVPIMFSYPFFQKYFISGLTIGAVKG